MLFSFKTIHCIQAFISRWSLDTNERNFISYTRSLKKEVELSEDKKNHSNILVQIPADYFYLCLFFSALQQLNGSYKYSIGLWHQNIMSSPPDARFSNILYFARKIFNIFDRLKWQRLYKAIGIRKFTTLEIKYMGISPYRNEAHEIWKSLKTKHDVLDLVLNGTHCGDLIYDTYLRYRIQPTVDLQDVYLRLLIEKALQTQFKIRKVIKENKRSHKPKI